MPARKPASTPVGELDSWVAPDRSGVMCVHQRGIGHVLALHPIGSRTPGRPANTLRVDIRVDADQESDLVVVGRLTIDSELHHTALWALGSGAEVEWAVRHHRHSWIPADLPVGALRMAVDLTADLYYLEPAL